MICNCTLAGTSACKNCVNNTDHISEYNIDFQKTNYHPIFSVEAKDNEYLNIIGNLNKHIETLQQDNHELKLEIERLKKENTQ